MIVELIDVGFDGLDLEGEVPAEVLECGADDPVRCVGPVRCKLHCQVVDDHLLVDGALSAPLEMRCRRCDVAFAGELEHIPYHYDEELDPMPESVDLTEDIRESMILAFPSYPVCRESCKGLCAQCGANLNVGDCDCKPPTDLRWGALDRLALGKE